MSEFRAPTPQQLPHGGGEAIPASTSAPLPARRDGPGVRPGTPADGAGDQTVVSDAVRRAVVDAVARERKNARERPVRRRLAMDGDTAEPSAELTALLEHLRSTVTRYVLGRREAGIPIERVIPELKCIVREAESGERWFDPGDSLMEEVVRWSIEAYYDGSEQARAPRVH